MHGARGRYILERIASVDSTNSECKRRIADGRAGPGLVLVADAQTGGRGRRGATWVTVPGRSLALSVVASAPMLARPARVTLMTAVAAARALERAGSRDVRIKWPNDLMRGEGKLGGILVESARHATAGELLVIGVGVNLALRPDDHDPSMAPHTADAGLPCDDASRERLAEELVDEIASALDDVGTPADDARGAEFRRRSWLTGRRARLVYAGAPLDVLIADVTADGDLLTDDGRLLRGEHVRFAGDAAVRSRLGSIDRDAAPRPDG